MTRALVGLAALGAVAWTMPALVACGGVNEVVCEGRIEGNRCIIDPIEDTSTGTTDAAPPQDTSQPPKDTSQPPKDTSQPPKDVAVDTAPDPEWVCEPAFEATKPIGAACGRHCECETGYCYDEAYLGDFRFCTRECDGDCGKGANGLDNQCLNLNNSAFASYNLTLTWICQRGCVTLDDCAAYSGVYDSCGTGTNVTQWLNQTLATQSSCTILSEVK